MKLLLISLFLIGTVSSCENVVNNNTEKDPLNESLSIESDTKINNPLANKKFYYLDKEENGELTLSIFPYLEDDYDMAKIIFTDSMLWLEYYGTTRVENRKGFPTRFSFNLSLTNDGLSRNSKKL